MRFDVANAAVQTRIGRVCPVCAASVDARIGCIAGRPGPEQLTSAQELVGPRSGRAIAGAVRTAELRALLCAQVVERLAVRAAEAARTLTAMPLPDAHTAPAVAARAFQCTRMWRVASGRSDPS